MRDHLKWREDATIRCLCVLALDRFSDFLTDRAVAPVRETVAQVLAMLLRHVEKEEKTEIKYETKLVKHEESGEHLWTDKQVYAPVVELVQKTLKSLYVLTNRTTWEERLSGFLGIKYLMATRHDLVHDLLPLVLPAVIQG
jgi:TATA-binding protein-associated factor